jgi:hypothetical protein
MACVARRDARWNPCRVFMTSNGFSIAIIISGQLALHLSHCPTRKHAGLRTHGVVPVTTAGYNDR